MPTVASRLRALPVDQTFLAFRHRNYRLWFSGQLVSLIGTWMQTLAQQWLVLGLTNSPFMLGVVGFCQSIPVLFFSLIGGAISDRVSKRNLLLVTQTASMLLAFALGILTITELVQIWHVLFIATSLGVVNAFDTPARQAFTVELVGREDLANAIALNSSMFNGARIIGPAIAGVIISIPQIGLGGAFLLNGVSFLAVIAGLLAIRVPRPTHLAIGGDPLRGMTAGLRYLHRRRDLSTIMLLIMIVSIFGFSYTTLLPIFARDVLHIGAAGQGAMMTTVGAGALLAALSLASQGRQGKKGLRFTIGNTLLPLMLLVLAVSRWVPLSFAAIFVVGWAFITQNATANTLIQTNVPDHLRGRVMSVWTITVMGMTPFGSLWAGTLASAIGAPAALAVGAMVCLVGSLVALWHVPEVRRMD